MNYSITARHWARAIALALVFGAVPVGAYAQPSGLDPMVHQVIALPRAEPLMHGQLVLDVDGKEEQVRFAVRSGELLYIKDLTSADASIAGLALRPDDSGGVRLIVGGIEGTGANPGRFYQTASVFIEFNDEVEIPTPMSSMRIKIKVLPTALMPADRAAIRGGVNLDQIRRDLADANRSGVCCVTCEGFTICGAIVHMSCGSCVAAGSGGGFTDYSGGG